MKKVEHQSKRKNVLYRGIDVITELCEEQIFVKIVHVDVVVSFDACRVEVRGGTSEDKDMYFYISLTHTLGWLNCIIQKYVNGAQVEKKILNSCQDDMDKQYLDQIREHFQASLLS